MAIPERAKRLRASRQFTENLHKANKRYATCAVSKHLWERGAAKKGWVCVTLPWGRYRHFVARNRCVDDARGYIGLP